MTSIAISLSRRRRAISCALAPKGQVIATISCLVRVSAGYRARPDPNHHPVGAVGVCPPKTLTCRQRDLVGMRVWRALRHLAGASRRPGRYDDVHRDQCQLHLHECMETPAESVLGLASRRRAVAPQPAQSVGKRPPWRGRELLLASPTHGRKSVVAGELERPTHVLVGEGGTSSRFCSCF